MPEFISPLDENFISLKRAALLIAREQSGIEPRDIMELFKYAIFARQFERGECARHGAGSAENWDLPLLRIEAPPKEGFLPRMSVDAQPQEYFAVTATTVAEILCERDALPGKAENWSEFTRFPRASGVREGALRALAHIPYAAFPPKAHSILGDILLAKSMLRAWMVLKGYALPDFLQGVASPAANPGAKSDDDLVLDALRGRPRKAGWIRIEELIHKLRDANPHLQRSMLAYDARKIAATEFDEKDLPSLETITRQMKNILGPES